MPDKKIEKRNKGSSIKDVAELAGVSVGTVSHALNSRGYVKKETKEKIVRAAAELNYIPNRAGRILKTNETKLIMLAIPDTSNEIYFGMIEEVQKNIKEKGYSLLLYYTQAEFNEEIHTVRLLEERVIDGLILVHFSYDQNLLEKIEKAPGPVVLIGMCNHLWANCGYEFDTISIDVYNGIFTVVQHLIKLGHSKIGYLAGRKDIEVYEQRYKAYKAALKEAGIKYRDDYVVWDDYTEVGGYNSGRILYLNPDRPTAICASNDLQAIGCWEAIKDITDDGEHHVAVTGMDNLNISKILGITSLDMKETQMGERAAKMILGRLSGTGNISQNIYLRPELKIRDSSFYQ